LERTNTTCPLPLQILFGKKCSGCVLQLGKYNAFPIGRLPPANDKEGGDPAIIFTSPPLDTQIRTLNNNMNLYFNKKQCE
jgi:hypothetical protein